MHILFVNPTFTSPSITDRSRRIGVNVHWGIASMSALLKSRGHQVSALHLDWYPGDGELLDLLRAKVEGVDLIGFSFTYHQEYFVRRWVALAKKEFGLPIITGGNYSSMEPEEVIGWEGVDYLCRGEGEWPLLELMDELGRGGGRTDIQSIWFKTPEGVARNPVRPIQGGLDDIPPYDYSLFDLNDTNVSRKRMRAVFYLVSRGCPFSCTYCANHAIRAIYPNQARFVRFQSVDRTISELKRLLALAPYARSIAFSDITFNYDRKWVLEFCRRYKAEIGLPYRCTIRLDLMSREIAEAFADSGCYRVSYGLESGSEWLRKTVLKRPWGTEKILEQARHIHEVGLQATSSNMVGLPHETLAMSLETMKLNARCKVDTAIVSIFCPHPNTELKKYCEEHGLIDHSVFVEDDMHDTVLRQDCVTPAEVRYAQRMFRTMVAVYRRIYELPAPLSGVLEKLADAAFLCRAVPHDLITRVHDRYFFEWLLSRQYKRLEAPLLKKMNVQE